MRGVLLAVLLVAACQVKQPAEPSYFTHEQAANAPLSCKQTVDCYGQCRPRVEECMLRCDERSSYYPVQRARAVANCEAEFSCADDECRHDRCGDQYEACLNPLAPAPPSPPPNGQ